MKPARMRVRMDVIQEEVLRGLRGGGSLGNLVASEKAPGFQKLGTQETWASFRRGSLENTQSYRARD